MSKVDEIMALVAEVVEYEFNVEGPWCQPFDTVKLVATRAALRDLISASLVEARREGVAAMRASVESALDDLPLPDGFFVSDIMGAIDAALPRPT